MKLSITVILFAIFANHVIASGRKRVKKYRKGMSKRTRAFKPTSTIHVTKEPMDEGMSVPNLQPIDSIGLVSVAMDVTRPESSKVEVLASASDAELSEEFSKLLRAQEYDKLIEFGKKMGATRFSEILVPLITSLEHVKGIQDRVVRSFSSIFGATFLVNGDSALVKDLIAHDLSPDNDGGKWHFGCREPLGASKLALKTNRYEQFLDSYKLYMHYAKLNIRFMGDYLNTISFDGGIHLRRLLVSRESFDHDYQIIFDEFISVLVWQGFYAPESREHLGQLLPDIFGAPFPMPFPVFAKAVLTNPHTDRLFFLEAACKEMVEEGLKVEGEEGSIKLWAAIREKFPDRSFPEKPSSGDVGTALCLFKTKEEMESERTDGALEYLAPLRDASLPSRPLSIILEYEPLLDVKRKIKTKEQLVQ